MSINIDRGKLRYAIDVLSIYTKNNHVDLITQLLLNLRNPLANYPRPPAPSGLNITSILDGYYDKDAGKLKMWYGAASTQNYEDVYYSECPDFPSSTQWTDPVKVIDKSAFSATAGGGIRDPNVVVLGDTVYVFGQGYDGSEFRPITLSKVAKGSENDPTAYTHIGYAVDKGASGEFDDSWTASPAVCGLLGLIFCFYEARNASDNYSIGIAVQKVGSIETVPHTKLGQALDINGNVITTGVAGRAIVPSKPFGLGGVLLLPYSFYNGSVWRVGYAVLLDLAEKKFYDIGEFSPNIGAENIAHIHLWARIDDKIYVTIGNWGTGSTPDNIFEIDASNL